MNMKAKDPVCGCTIEPNPFSWRHTFGGYEFYFCSDACMTRFMGNPGRYAGESRLP